MANCAECGVPLAMTGGQGRPRTYCLKCRADRFAAYQRAYLLAYHEAHRDEIAAQHRAYREQNRDRIKLRLLARAEAKEKGISFEEVLAAWHA